MQQALNSEGAAAPNEKARCFHEPSLDTRGDNPGEVAFGQPPAVDLGLEPGGMQHQVIATAAGHYHTCAILGTGAIKCWGYNALGQLGLGDTTNRGTDTGQMGDALPAVDL